MKTKRTKAERKIHYDGFYGLDEWKKFCNMKVSDVSASEDDRMRKRLVWIIKWKDVILRELKKLGYDESICEEQFWNVIEDAEEGGNGDKVHELRFLGAAYEGRVGMAKEPYEKAWVYTLEECCHRTIEVTFATKDELWAFYSSLCEDDDDEGKDDKDQTGGIFVEGWSGPLPLHELASYTISGAEDFAGNKYFPEGYVPQDKVPNREQFIGKRMYIGLLSYDEDSTDLTDAFKVRALEMCKDIEAFTFRECMFNFDDEQFEGYGYRRLA